jgi:hypothetical protein
MYNPVETEPQYGLLVPVDEKNVMYEMRMNEFCINYMSRATVPNEFVNLSVTTRPGCSISPINTTASDTSASVGSASAICNETSYLGPTQFLQTTNNSAHTLSANPCDSGYQSSEYNTSSIYLPNISSMYTSSPYYQTNQSTILSKHLAVNQAEKSVRFQSTPTKPCTLLPPKKVNFHSILDLAKSSGPITNDKQLIHNVSEIPSFNSTSIIETVAAPSVISSLTISNVTQKNSKNNVSSDLSHFNAKLRAMSQSIVNNKENNPCDSSKVIINNELSHF